MLVDPYREWLQLPPSRGQRNHYQLLGLRSQGVSSEEILAAYERKYTLASHYAWAITKCKR